MSGSIQAVGRCRPLQALHQLPKSGKVRLAIDWTIEDQQHVLVVSLIVGRRATPIYGAPMMPRCSKGA